MRILLTGATGFIGAALTERFLRDGHTLRLSARNVERVQMRWPGVEVSRLDFAEATHVSAWMPLLAGVDAIVNTVGIIRETSRQPFVILHVEAPCALFEAAARAGVSRVIQVSALGADADAQSAYHRSKRAADETLTELRLHSSIVQPSLVFGEGGVSAALFEQIAALPLVPLPGEGEQCVQPIHLDDLCDAVSQLLQMPTMPPRVAAVGPRCLTLREYLAELRTSLGARRARWLCVPMPLVRFAARVGDRIGSTTFDSDRLAMLERGNCADPSGIAAVLGRMPRDAARFIEPGAASVRLRVARLPLALALLRTSIALVWIVSGLVSFGAWPVSDSLAMLARTGLHGTIALVALYGAAALDIGFGVGMVAAPARIRAHLYDAQIAIILVYTAIIAICLPELLLHPFAPIVKNLTILAALLLLRWTEKR